MRRPRVGCLVPFVPFYEAIVSLRGEKERLAEAVHAALRQHVDVLGEGLVENEAEAAGLAAEFASREVDAVVVAPALAVFGALPWAALAQLRRVPVAIWSAPPLRQVSSSFGIPQVIANSSGLAAMALANTLTRHQRVFRVFTGDVAEAPPDLVTFLRAAQAAAVLRTGTLGRIGPVFPGMTDVAMDAKAWQAATGGHIVDVPGTTFVDRCMSIASERVEDTARQYERHAARESLTPDELARSARIALALEGLRVEHDLVGGAFNCHGESCLGHPALGVVACLAVSEQTRAGRPFSCTGDLPTAVALVLAKTISGVAIYAELDLVDEPHDAVLLANGGEGDAWVEGAPLELFPNENFRGVRGRGASVRTAIEAAPATLVSFTPVDERATPPRYRLIVAEGQLSASLPAALSGFHAAFRFEGRSADDGFRRWCNAGAPHHLAVARGHCGDAMAVVCEHFGWDHRSITSAPC